MQALETALLETAQEWEQDGCAGGEMREIIGAVDESLSEKVTLSLRAASPSGGSWRF
jgi:hypothetical protein